MLGDLYLWRASCKGGDAGKADYREAAKCYFRWITDTRSVGDGASKMAYYVNSFLTSEWIEYSSSTGTSYGVSMGLWSASAGGYNNENITIIPMDSASSQGYFSDVPSLYNTERDATTGVYTTTTNFSITPSQRMQDISAAQVYCLVDENNVPQEFQAEMIEENPLLKGDLRLSTQWETNTRNITTGGNAGQFTKSRGESCGTSGCANTRAQRHTSTSFCPGSTLDCCKTSGPTGISARAISMPRGPSSLWRRT